jgi:ubiquitin carboxyl-terminal hydrolase 4/11/15
VPEEAWKAFVSWYGKPQIPIARKVIERGEFSRICSLELYPPQVKTFLLVHPVPVIFPEEPILHTTISQGDTFDEFKLTLADALLSPCRDPARIRVYRITVTPEEPSSSRLSRDDLLKYKPRLVQEPADGTMENEIFDESSGFVIEVQPPGGDWSPVALDESSSRRSSPPRLFSGEGFFDRLSTNKKSLTLPSPAASPAPLLSSPMKFTVPRRTVQPGTLGLGNMGNTCFMNSALQCLAHNKELSDYFLTGVYRDELNPDNPLGMHGAIAEAFGALLHRIWDPSGSSSSYSPREFKQALQRFAPQFSGYQQHDSQELVAFLLDGLHEDLNRVLKKPYVEKPDWEGGGDLELIQHARKSWDGYMLRNDSVIVDLFQGQYMSTLVCPECQKVSITFDPFMYLTLPLPVNKKWRHDIYYVPWDVNKPHLKVPIEISINSSFKDLRNLLGRWMNVPADNLLTLEIWSHRFYKNLHDNVLCSEALDNDVVVCFELPCHAQQSRTFKKKDDDPLIVPVSLADLPIGSANSYLRTTKSSGFGYPFIVVIQPEDAQNPDAIYDAVIHRLERFTANSRDLFTWEPVDDPMDADSEGMEDREKRRPEPESITKFELPIVNSRTAPLKLNLEEDDISDSPMDIDSWMDGSGPPAASTSKLKKTGTKKNIFQLTIQSGQGEYGTSSMPGQWRTESIEQRAESSKPLLRPDEGLLCQFDENMKPYYFGDESSRWEHALWDRWKQFIHPEYEASLQASSSKQNKGINLTDCLDEFVKEEQLGEDDLWYCPQCKKHQQASKKFDLWNAPDVLVVHLKRFSNSRALRDKIDTFVDFPTEGLDLSDMVMERKIARRLAADGQDLQELGLGDSDQSLVYDLFAVDEHIGGLGGGHYRAYALNHANHKWYHFDDSHVTEASAGDSVNANAYLLFYRRRTSSPLGGKTHIKIEAAQNQAASQANESQEDTQLPTPPSETASESTEFNKWRVSTITDAPNTPSRKTSRWFNSGQPPTPEDNDLSVFTHDLNDSIGPSNRLYGMSPTSPSSSIAAEPDTDDRDISQSSSFLNSPDLPPVESAAESPSSNFITLNSGKQTPDSSPSSQ